MMVAPLIAAAGIGAVSDIAGGLVNQYFAGKAADKSYKFQKKVLQNQVQWRVDDAVRAGLHPLAALGVNPASGPVGGSVGDLGGAISSMGQNIGRAAEAFLTPEDKIAARSALLGLEQQQANIDLTKSQIAGSQKALLTQGSTPGIASRIGINDPFTDVNMKIHDPGVSQRAEDSFGDIIGEAYGIGNYARSVWNASPSIDYYFRNEGSEPRYPAKAPNRAQVWR